MTPSAKTKLISLDFTSEIELLTKDFTGREWLKDEVDSWLKSEGKRFFILTGEPGVGKSAFAAWLTRTRKDIVAYNFCIAGRNDTIVPNTVLRSFGAQLGHSLPDYGKALANTIKPEKISVDVKIDIDKMSGGEITGVIINHLHASDPKEVVDIILRAPFAWPELPLPENPVIILVDSLDEAVTYRTDVNLVTLLAGLNDLPPWVRIFCTSRPERSALCYFDGLAPYILPAESRMNLDDVELYVSKRVERKTMQARIKSTGKSPEDLAVKLKEKDLHKGNFLFAKVLLDDIEAGHQSLDDLNALPKTIDEIYHRFLMRFKAQWEKRYQPILGILAVAMEPLSETHLANFTGIGRTSMRQSLGKIIQFLDEHEDGGMRKTYTLYHQSFRDYLLDEKRNVDFWCALEDGHQRIVDYYRGRNTSWSSVNWGAVDVYGLSYLPLHALRSGELPALIEQPSFLIYCDSAAVRDACEQAQNLNETERSVVAILALAYPYLATREPVYRAAILHMTAVKQGASDVANLLKTTMSHAPFQVSWVDVRRVELPYRTRMTERSTEALAAVDKPGGLLVIFAEEIDSVTRRLNVWHPASEDIRSTVIDDCGRIIGLSAVQVGERTFIELHEGSIDSDRMRLLDLDSLETVHLGWNGVVVALPCRDEPIVAEADFGGALFLRPLKAAPMWFPKGNLASGLSLTRNVATLDEIPSVTLTERIRQIIPVVDGLPTARLILVDSRNHLHIHDPFGDRSTSPLSAADFSLGSLEVKAAVIKNEPVVAVLSSANKLIILLDPRDGRLLAQIDYDTLRLHTEARHWLDIDILDTGDGALLLLSTSEDEVIFWDLARGRVARVAEYDDLTAMAVSSLSPVGLLVTGHERAIRVWDAASLLRGGRGRKGYTELLAAGVVDGNHLTVALTGYARERERQVRIYNLKTGDVVYEHKENRPVFRPHFLALCHGTAGPFVVFQPDWFNDVLEVHYPAAGAVPATWRMEHGRRPTWLDDPEFRLLDFNQTWVNPSRAYRAFVTELLNGQTQVADLWEARPRHCALDRQGRVLAGNILIKDRHLNIRRCFAFHRADKAPILATVDHIQPDSPDLLAVALYEERIVAATFSRKNRTIAVWQAPTSPASGYTSSKSIALLSQIDFLVPPIASFGVIDGQLLLAFGQQTEVTVFPLTAGPIIKPVHIPEQVTAVICVPDGALFMATSQGILSVQL